MKKTWVILIAGFLMACALPSIPQITPEPPPGNPGLINPNQAQEPIVPELSISSSGFTVVRLHPEDGNLVTQIEGEARQATSLGQHMFVEFDASW